MGGGGRGGVWGGSPISEWRGLMKVEGEGGVCVCVCARAYVCVCACVRVCVCVCVQRITNIRYSDFWPVLIMPVLKVDHTEVGVS